LIILDVSKSMIMENVMKMNSGKMNVLMTFVMVLFFSFALTAQVKVDQDQNVGIGTPTPSEKLDVAGNIKVDGSYNDSEGNTIG